MQREEIIRYSKQIMLEDIGPEGQRKLKDTKVLVIGAGGLGCPVLQYLNAGGIGTLGIADPDTVDATNLHRQVLYGPADIGTKKVTVACARLACQNPFTHLVPYDAAVNAENAAGLFSGYDIIVDGCDNFATRYIVNDACCATARPLVYGSILGYEGQLAVFNLKGSNNLRHIFPSPPDPGDVPDCSENGVLGTVPGIIGNIMAQMVLDVALDRYTAVNRFRIFNTRNLEQTVLHF
jgi:molybdopterin/thiamine biosynthesis adenylyltransferase